MTRVDEMHTSGEVLLREVVLELTGDAFCTRLAVALVRDFAILEIRIELGQLLEQDVSTFFRFLISSLLGFKTLLGNLEREAAHGVGLLLLLHGFLHLLSLFLQLLLGIVLSGLYISAIPSLS